MCISKSHEPRTTDPAFRAVLDALNSAWSEVSLADRERIATALEAMACLMGRKADPFRTEAYLTVAHELRNTDRFDLSESFVQMRKAEPR